MDTMAETENVNIEIVHFSQGNLSKYLPAALRRIADFCTKYNSDAHPDVMLAQIHAQVIAQTPTVIVVVGARGNKVIAHMLVELQEYYGCRYAMITQLAVDRDAKVLRETMERGLDMVDTWTKSMGGIKQRIWARSPSVARLFRRHGFIDSEKVLMERMVPADAESTADVVDMPETAVS
jgi:hypothetical protein